MNLAWVISAGTSAGLGLLVGGAVAWHLCTGRAERRHKRLVVAAREQYATGTQGLRATNARLQAAVETEKQSVQARLTQAAQDHRTEVARLEGQLRFAYAEIDRLQAHERPEPADAGEGREFALTRPFER